MWDWHNELSLSPVLEAQVSVSIVTGIISIEKCWSAKWMTQLDFGQPYSCFAWKMADGRLLFPALLTSNTPKSLSFMIDAVMELSFIATLRRAFISDRTTLILPYSCVIG